LLTQLVDTPKLRMTSACLLCSMMTGGDYHEGLRHARTLKGHDQTGPKPMESFRRWWPRRATQMVEW
jgi:hypothetical protein